jgi:hypothetical protein
MGYVTNILEREMFVCRCSCVDVRVCVARPMHAHGLACMQIRRCPTFFTPNAVAQRAMVPTLWRLATEWVMTKDAGGARDGGAACPAGADVDAPPASSSMWLVLAAAPLLLR